MIHAMSLPPVCRILVGALYKGSTKVEIRLFNNCLQDDFSDGEYLFSLCTCGCTVNKVVYAKWRLFKKDIYVCTYEAIEKRHHIFTLRVTPPRG